MLFSELSHFSHISGMFIYHKMTQFASELSEHGLCICRYTWKNLETLLIVVKPHFY